MRSHFMWPQANQLLTNLSALRRVIPAGGDSFWKFVQLNYARWGSDDCEVDLVESSLAFKPQAALEIKWSDKYATRPEALKGLMKFARHNGLTQAWATTRSLVRQQAIDGCDIRQWPAAALAFHYGVRAVQGRLAGYEAQIREISA